MIAKSQIYKKLFEPDSEYFIKLKYSFLEEENKFKYQKSAKDVTKDTHAKEFLLKNLADNKINLTAGKLIKKLNHKNLKKSIRFGGHQNLIDLETFKEGYFIEPGESIVVLTNEWLQLDSHTFGLIISRVSNYTRGLVVTTSYVDSNWQGLLELIITNFSKKKQLLSLGDEIARIFFINLDGSGNSYADSSIIQNTLHYGLTWHSILKDKVDPFQRNYSYPSESFSFNWILQSLKENYKIAGGFVGMIALISFVFSIYTKFIKLIEIDKTIIKIENDLTKIKSQRIETGKAIISFNEYGKGVAEFKLKNYYENGVILISNSSLINELYFFDSVIISEGENSVIKLYLTKKDKNNTADNCLIQFVVCQ